MQCVSLDAVNTISYINVDIADCSQYILMAASEYNSGVLTQVEVFQLFGAAASLYGLVFVFKLALKQLGF